MTLCCNEASLGFQKKVGLYSDCNWSKSHIPELESESEILPNNGG